MRTIPYDDRPLWLRVTVALIGLVLYIVSLLAWVAAGWVWLPLCLLTLPLFISLLQLTFAPFMRLIGSIEYVSPMLLVYGPTPEKYNLHNGTTFAFLYNFWGVPPGALVRYRTLEYHYAGFLGIIERIKSGQVPPTVLITGTSYFFSERTMQKLGFRIEPPSIWAVLNLWMNGFDLFWMYSYAQGRIAWPRLTHIRRAVTTGAELVAHEASIRRLYDLLQTRADRLAAQSPAR